MTGTNGKAITTVALYARVSTLDKGQDPEMQLRELRAHAQAQSWAVYSEYVDHGISGSKDSRPQLNRMMSDAQAGKLDAVIVWKLDRFSRSLRHLIVSLETLAASGVAFVSLRDNLDLTTATGRLMFQIIGAFAEFERAITRERVRAGLIHAKAKGKTLGRKARTDIDVSALLALRAAGKSWRKIAAQTGIPMATVRDRVNGITSTSANGLTFADAAAASATSVSVIARDPSAKIVTPSHGTTPAHVSVR